MSVAGGPVARVLCTAVVVVIGIGTVTAQLTHDDSVDTMHAATGPLAAGLQLLASLALVGAGLLVWIGQGSRSVGPAILGAAVAWMAPVWIAWEGAPGLLASVGVILATFLLPCLVDVALGFPDRGSRDAPRRRLVTAGYVVTGVYVVVRAALYDPFLDPECWVNCLDASFLVRSSPDSVRLIDGLWKVSVVVVGVLVVVMSAGAQTRPQTTPSPTRLVVAAATGAAVTQAVRSLLSTGPEDPRRDLLHALFILEAATLVVLAVALGWATWRREQRRAAAMGRLAEVASEAAGIHSLRTALALATGCTDLELAYWVPAAGTHVDASGQPVAEDPAEGGVSVLRHRTPVALITSSRHTTSAAMVAQALGPAARLALDNERLRAEELYHVQRLAESRARIMAVSDQARRELERDLHDGAQQRLLAVLYSLQLASGAARGRGDLVRVEALDRSILECRAALAELRDLAHGTFPAILDTAGLAPALATLGDQTRVVLSVDDRSEGDLPGPVAHAAYLAVASVVVAAADGDAGPVRVKMEMVGDHLLATIHGAPGADHMRTVDRVSALGGSVSSDDAILRVEIPCA